MAAPLQLVFDHIALHFNTSEPETRRIIKELGCAIVGALQQYGEIELPRIGKLVLSEEGLNFEASKIYNSLLSAPKVPVPPKRDVRIHIDNHRDVIRQSLFTYLQLDFPLEQPWQHPNGRKFSYQEVRAQLTKLRRLDDPDYHVFYARVLQARRLDRTSYVFNSSESALKRRCDLQLSAILTLLLHPDLETDTIQKFYRIDN